MAVPGYKGWGWLVGGKQADYKDTELLLDDSEVDDIINMVDELPGLSSKKRAEHLRYREIEPELGLHLLAPLNNTCVDIKLDIWQYVICIGGNGGNVTQINTQNVTERYTVGSFNGSKLTQPTDKLDLPEPYGTDLQALRNFTRPPINE